MVPSAHTSSLVLLKERAKQTPASDEAGKVILALAKGAPCCAMLRNWYFVLEAIESQGRVLKVE